jgi:hypothetical protein
MSMFGGAIAISDLDGLARRAKGALRCACVLVLLALFGGVRAYGDVGVILNESLDTSVARITGSGHTAVYLSRICPESPVKLRLCRPGEEGSVISNYTTLGEDQPFEWNVVPLSLYLYGVEDPRNRPLFGSEKIKHALEERYREKYLSAYCASEFCRTSGKAEWREMVAATISRSLYIFAVKTTEQQDEQLIAELNAGPNQNHFNGVTRNCATFARRVVNTYFPGATKPEYLNDFGMTSPKAIARSFTHYALRHPESDFRVLHFAQVPGTYKRSSECRDGTEQLYHSKKLLVPMILFAPHELPVAAASYLLTGRFNPERESEKFPTVEAAVLNHQIQDAKSQSDEPQLEELTAAENQERAGVVGSAEEWKNYRKAFDLAVDDAVHAELVPDRDYLNRLFRRLDQRGIPTLDDNGNLWIELPEDDTISRVGLSASNLLLGPSDAQLADQFVLARIDHILKSPKHGRETMLEFKKDWALLDQTRENRAVSIAGTSAPTSTSHDETSARKPGEKD